VISAKVARDRLLTWVKRQSPVRLVFAGAALCCGLAVTTVGLEALIRARLNPADFTAPTRLYARPMVLASGVHADRDKVRHYLRALGYRETRGVSVGSGEYRLGSDLWTIGRRAFRAAGGMDPGGAVQVEIFGDQIATIYDARGRSLPSVMLEPLVIRTVGAEDGEVSDRVPVTLDEVPRTLVNAIVTVEDRRFFTHEGLDLRRIVGAMVANVRAGHVTQGASTITQQLARTLWLSSSRTLWRKIREAAMAVTLEARYPKREILEAYLNEVYLGQDGALAIRGVGRAAQFYFGKDVTQLDAAESALLAGIIRGPSLYSPFHDPEAARARRDLALREMHEQGVLTDAQYGAARREPLHLRRTAEPDVDTRYFADWVLRDAPPGNGLAVFTTLDPELQARAHLAVVQGLRRIERAHPALKRAAHPLQAALVALNPWTGEVLAMVGGRDYAQSQFDRATGARRQPGSAFKPVVAVAALAPLDDSVNGGAPQFTLATQVEDDPLNVQTPQGLWHPVNYDGSFGGPVTLREALEHSLNVPFARVGLAVGAERIVDFARTLGIESPLQAVPSLALGASEVTLLELTRAYGVLAAYGYRTPSVHTLAVLDPSGEFVARATLSGAQVLSPAVAYLVTSGLEGVVEEGTGRALRGLGVRGAVAAKSGTTSDYRDAWFVGYTRRLAVGVWVGFDDGTSVGLTGSAAALPIFARFLNAAGGEVGDEEFPVPDGIEFAYAGRDCQREAFLAGTAPEEQCAPIWSALRPVAGRIKALVKGFLKLFGRR
jgi:penicillin-binding protein 1B